MEKKKLQRVVGISVVVAFVIVLIPFLFTKKDLSQQEASASDQQSTSTMAASDANQPAAPQNTSNPAPDANQTNGMNNSTPGNTADANNANMQNTPASNAEDNGITPINAPVASNAQNPAPGTANPAEMNNQPTAPGTANPADMNNQPAPINSAQQNTSATSTMNPAAPVNPSNSAATPNPSATPTQAPNVSVGPASAESTVPAENTVQMAPAVSTDANETAHPQATAEKTAALAPSPAKEVKTKHVHKSLIVKKASHSENLANLKKPAWVVQMGSFKEKSNAHRLVDQLRSSGYKAFTHEVTSPKGVVRTRVYIGPEFKQASAQQLTNKIEHDVKLRGYVVPYKPMAL